MAARKPKPGASYKEVFVRIPMQLIERVDKHAGKLRKTTGMTVSRTNAVRALLSEALEANGQ